MLTTTRPATVEEVAVLLDGLTPGWADRVPEDFDLVDAENCVGYHAFGSWEKAEVEVAKALPNGVRVGSIFASDWLYHNAWAAAIKERTSAHTD